MFWVNGKDVIFTASFPMKLGDDILLSPPGLAGGIRGLTIFYWSSVRSVL